MTTRALTRTLCREMPGMDPEKVKRVWQVALDVVKRALLEGHHVVLEEICTIKPYVKAASNGYNPFFKENRPIAETRYVRFEPSVRLVEAIKSTPLPTDVASIPQGKNT